jgi:hypothetical protein
MMPRLKRVLKHAVTGYIPQGTLNDSPPPCLIKSRKNRNPRSRNRLSRENRRS